MSEIDLAAAVIDRAVMDALHGPPLTPTRPGQNEIMDAIAAWVGVSPQELFKIISRQAGQRREAGLTRKDAYRADVKPSTRLLISQARARAKYEDRKRKREEGKEGSTHGSGNG